MSKKKQIEQSEQAEEIDKNTEESVESSDKDSEENTLFKELIPDENAPEWERRSAVNHDEYCDWEIEKAKLKGLPDPEFDFRNFYQKGDPVYLIRHFKLLKEKEMCKVIIRSVYPRWMVATLDGGYCKCIGYEERNMVFVNKQDAKDMFDSINAKIDDEYDLDTGKKKRKKHVKEEDDDSEDFEENPEETSESEE